MKPEKSERLSASQIDELEKILGLEAAQVKEAFKFYFPGASWALEEGLSGASRSRALLMYSGFKGGYMGALAKKSGGRAYVDITHLLGGPPR